jgi:hypothetical protein
LRQSLAFQSKERQGGQRKIEEKFARLQRSAAIVHGDGNGERNVVECMKRFAFHFSSALVFPTFSFALSILLRLLIDKVFVGIRYLLGEQLGEEGEDIGEVEKR